MKKGDIYLAVLDPARGSEMKKTRPVVVFQNDIATKYGNTVTILPVSSKPYKERVFEVPLRKDKDNQLFCDSKIVVNQIRTLDKKRLLKKIGFIKIENYYEIHETLKTHLGM